MRRARSRKPRPDDLTPEARALLEKIQRMHEHARARASELRSSGQPDLDWPLEMTPDHPMAKLLGFEKAKAMLETPAIKRHALAAHRRNEVRRMSLERTSVREIAKALDLVPDYVVQLRRLVGVSGITHTPAADHNRTEIARMNRKGMHDGEIARALGISRPYVCQVRRRLGIPPARRKR